MAELTDTIRIEVPAALVEAVRGARERCSGDVTRYIGTGEYAPSEYGCALDELAEAILSAPAAPPAAAQGEAGDEAMVDALASLAERNGAQHGADFPVSVADVEAARSALLSTLRALRAERDEAIAEVNETRAGAATLRSLIDAARAERDAAVREADRWRHGVPVEGDYVCRDSLALDEARAMLARTEALGARLAAAARSAEPCVGEWVSGSGGHKEHAGGCARLATWWDGMWAYCDEHAGARADGHYDRMPWRDAADALAAWDALAKGSEGQHG